MKIEKTLIIRSEYNRDTLNIYCNDELMSSLCVGYEDKDKEKNEAEAIKIFNDIINSINDILQRPI